MKKFPLLIPPETEEFVRHLHPEVKRKVRSALEEIEQQPQMGKRLTDELTGLFTFRVSHYRIVYDVNLIKEQIEVVDIAKRSVVYERVQEKRKHNPH